MIRHLNFTNRARIRRDDISIELDERNDQLWFDADLSGLSEYELPSESLVFLESYRLSDWMRFSYGTVGNLVPPENRHLLRFTSPAGIKFRVKVTAAGQQHKLLAEADAVPLLRPDVEESAKEPLLHVLPEPDLGQEIYRLQFGDNYPVLLINNQDGDYKEIGRSSAFMSLVLPAVLGQILTRTILIDHKKDDDDMTDWRCQWIAFAKQLRGLGDIPPIDDVEACTEWIQDAVTKFARQNGVRARFMEFWREGL